MATAAEKFRVDISKFADLGKNRLKAFITIFLQDLNQAIVEASAPPLGPNVITGFFRGSWRAGKNSPGTDLIGSPDPGGGSTISIMNLVAAGIEIGDVYFVTNGAVYAMRLEFGFVGIDKLGRHYNQAGFAMVRSTLARADQIAVESARKAKAL